MTAARQPERRHPRGVGRAWADLPLRSKGLVVVAVDQDRRAQAAVLHTKMEVEREIAQVRILVQAGPARPAPARHARGDGPAPAPGQPQDGRGPGGDPQRGRPPGLIQRLLEQGARAFLTKPPDVKELLELLDAVAAERQAAIAAG